MKFKPILGSDLSGHIGGVVASHNRYGPYFRQRVKPVNKNTEAQQAQRGALSYVSQSWRGLDPYTQLAWNAAAVTKTSRTGDVVVLSGQSAFVFVNTIRERIGLPILNSPPTTPGAVALTLPIVSFDSASSLAIEFNVSDEWNVSGGGIIFSGAVLCSPGQIFARANLACNKALFPAGASASYPLPFAVPQYARLLTEFHATGDDGRQSTYRTVTTENTTYPAPPPALLSILSVTLVGTKKFLWLFDGPVTVTPGADSAYSIDGDGTGVAAAAGTNSVLVTFSTVATTPKTWTVVSQPTSIAEIIKTPQSGITD